MFHYFFDIKNEEKEPESQKEMPFTQIISNMDRLRQKYPGASIFDRLLLEANEIEQQNENTDSTK